MSLSNQRTHEGVKRLDPFNMWNKRTLLLSRSKTVEEEEKVIKEHANHLQRCVILENKTFVTKQTVETLLGDLVDLMGSNSVCNDFECSLLLSGLLDYGNGFENPERPSSEDLGILKPTFILINKPKSNI
ncbi:hypothetical protein BN7_937 [Wickerhamomyces ciferrii]|uniref:Uncharacterized protein n=1 Tax=Wickerhamomyces ciferrii (strain ATCC 14091 / BCRC 22168 / CBS 111 / JCM 3599 / NBRC 0793 / NRRL Y-1031 F-60-10) TaxID=1206466 RepID=K0KEP4_WICCF|nr:uncharacterized protein BN7_937 [Wickerhamomyces ciferrii]CCH41396.1 hypothetical protein BN7_937 [Wickerhamomyces ciferrii]